MRSPNRFHAVLLVAGLGVAPVFPALAATPMDIPAQYARATDYLEFGRRILPAANAGDGVAQYHLYLVNYHCHVSWSAYFRRGKDGVATLDEAIARLTSRYQGDSLAEQLESARAGHAKCRHWFQARSELGHWNEWVEKAARAGEPHALMYTGRLMFGTEFHPTGEKRAAAMERIGRAVRTRLPELLFDYGSLQNRLMVVPQEEDVVYDAADIERLAWWVVACRLDPGCGGQEWQARICSREPACMEAGPVAWIQRQAQHHFSAITDRAREIEAALANDDWQKLGL